MPPSCDWGDGESQLGQMNQLRPGEHVSRAVQGRASAPAYTLHVCCVPASAILWPACTVSVLVASFVLLKNAGLDVSKASYTCKTKIL